MEIRKTRWERRNAKEKIGDGRTKIPVDHSKEKDNWITNRMSYKLW